MRKIRVAVLLSTVALSAFAQERPYTTRIDVSAIEVVAEVKDAGGRTPADLTAADFVIVEDGVERPAIALDYICATCAASSAAVATATQSEPAATPLRWESVIYIDYELSGRPTIREALRNLALQADRLTKYGTVEVIVADPSPRRLLAATSDPAAVAKALAAAGKLSPSDRLVKVRRQFLEQRNGDNLSPDEQFVGFNDTRSAIVEEKALIRAFLARVGSWLGTYPRRSPRALFLVADGFDVNPADFYADVLYPRVTLTDPNVQSRIGGSLATPADLKREVNMLRARSHANKLDAEVLATEADRNYFPVARDAAAAGWTIFSFRGGLSAALAADASTHATHPAANFTVSGGSRGNPGGSVQTNPGNPLIAFADATGGRVEADVRRFGDAIESLGSRIRLTYEVARRPDGVVRHIEVKPRRAGLIVNGSQWASSSTPELVAAGRASALLTGGDFRGELPVSARLAREQALATLDVRAGLEPFGELRPQIKAATVRMSIAVSSGPNSRVVHEIYPNVDLSRIDEASFSAPLQLPRDVDRIAVVVEELGTGMWGATAFDVPKNQPIAVTGGWREGIEWRAWNEALAEAQRAKKAIVHCAGCDEAMLAQVPLGAFVVTKTEDSVRPHVALLDPWGRPRFDWTPASAAELAAKLRVAATVTQQLVRAGELGDSAMAHLALGFVHLKMQSYEQSQREYALAEARARATGDVLLAQRARIQGAAALAQAGQAETAISELQEIVKTPQTQANEAEAWLVLGHVCRSTGNVKAAKDAYANAAKRAPEGSEIQKIAANLAGSV